MAREQRSPAKKQAGTASQDAKRRRIFPALRRAHRLLGITSLTLWAAPGEASTFLGGATTSSPVTIGIGADDPSCSTTTGSNAWGAIAVGCGANANITDPTDFLPGLGLNGGIAVGNGTSTTGANDIAIGSSTQAHSDSAIAIGVGTVAGVAGTNVNNPTAIGVDTTATGTNSIAVGTTARASGSSAVAVGPWSNAGPANTVAVGPQTTAAGIESTAIGYLALVPSGSGVAIGSRTIAEGGYAVALGSGAAARSTGTANGSPIAIGSNANATGVYGSPNPIDPGGSTFEAVAIGNAATATGQIGTALGWTSAATGLWSTAVGGAAAATADRATAVGVGAQASAPDALALGYDAAATQSGSVALGPGARTAVGARTAYVAYALAAPQTSAGEVSVGNPGAQRQITNVAAGAAPTDAVNVSQLNQIAQNTAGSLGGGASYDAATGAYTGPGYPIGGQTYNTVGDALAAQNAIVSTQGNSVATYLGGGVTYNVATGALAGGFIINGNSYATLTDAIGESRHIVNNLVQGTAGLVQQQDATAPITVGGNTGGTTVDMSGTAGNRRVTGVADGVAPSDAATINQLDTVTQRVNGQYARLNNRIHGVQSRANGGIAAAMAMAALPQAYLPSKSMVSLGGATWNGESGYALGLSTVSDNGSWVLKLSGATSSRGDYGGAVGVGYQW
ncbi:YadA family autotransporter adhesin [Bordetella genomosp. 11]|uniref:Adhesin n=1 Tax=Bordetella genomosp. 11 TaxID=1416808 RepID=A0A261UNG9_9BORD|nr:YadA-like family protein [Bordetella genomosp. 11]OZI62463.1 hypothetical protein CAL28_25145 [Bordetella genomosp. 11]